MKTTIIGYMGATLATIDVRPLPSAVAQVVLVERADVYEKARVVEWVAMAMFDEKLSKWSDHVRRSVAWRIDGVISWCGPFALGGELHHELLGRTGGLKALLPNIRAWDPIGERWVPVDPGPKPKPPRKRAPRPLEEDDDDNAASTEAAPRDATAELGAALTRIRVAVARREGASP